MSSRINAIRSILAIDNSAEIVSGENGLGIAFTEEGVDQFYPLWTQYDVALAALLFSDWASAGLAIREYFGENPEVKEEIKDLFTN